MEVFSKEMLMAKNNGWIRPNLTSNGTLGGNSFAVAADGAGASAYYAVDGNSTTYAQVPRSGFFTFYNPTPLKVTRLDFTFLSADTSFKQGNTNFVQGSNNNSSWSIIPISTYPVGQTSSTYAIFNNNSYYKYYRILAYSNSPSGLYLKELGITAEEQ